MPTSTLSAWSFINHGPLTTVFTAPASCFTSASQIQLGQVTTEIDNNNVTSSNLVPGFGLCNTGLPYWAQPGDCVPSGKAIDSQYAALDSANPTAASIIDYYSPGLYCPSNYVTVGVANNGADGSVTSSGAGFVPTAIYTNPGPVFNPGPNILLQGLDRGETAVLCCPNSFQVDIYGNCFSPLPSHPLPTEVCYYTVPEDDFTIVTAVVTIFGTPVSDGVIQETNSVPINETVTQTLTDDGTSNSLLTVVSMAPMITLIHNAAEASSITSTGTGTAVAGRPTATTTTKSGASGRAEITGNIHILLLSCWVVSLTAGILSSAT